MKYNLKNKSIKNVVECLIGEYGFSLSDSGVETYIENSFSGVELNYKGGKLTISVQKPNQVFWALKEFSDLFGEEPPKEDFHHVYTPRFEDLTYMLDCSRNAVYTIPVVKEVISQIAVAGYSSFMLYTEDTFKVKEYPYFGYLRNPYTEEDIKEIDKYARTLGIELIPCMQTLGHFNSIKRYPSMEHLFDIDEILLVGEEETYKFIEAMIAFCARSFSSRKINIGMDEAYLLGRGRYLDKHGLRKRFEIMKDHLEKVNEICKKYGFKPMMWSDMFFSLAINAQYGSMEQPVQDLVPEGIELIYWDYYHTYKEHYEEMLEKHRVFKNEISFATGAWKWLGFTPDNRYSFKIMEESAKACTENSIKHYIVTGWGDNGAESSCFSTMPSVYYAGYINFNDYEMGEKFQKGFKNFSGMELKDFLTIDLANRITENNDVEEKNSANKYLLFNDILLGTLDTIIEKGQSALYKKHAKKLHAAAKAAGKWAYIFKTQEDLCKVLAIKAELGVRLREAYKAGDQPAMAEILIELKKLYKLVEVFYKTFREQWNKEARPNGFDVQDLRIGALKQRILTATEKLSDYLGKKTESIPELEEELLCFMGHGKDFEKDLDQCEYRWFRMTSVNVNF